MTDLDFETLAHGITNGETGYANTLPNGQERPTADGLYLPMYGQLLNMIPAVIRQDIQNEGFTEAHFIYPHDEWQETSFFRRCTEAIKTAAERGRFR